MQWMLTGSSPCFSFRWLAIISLGPLVNENLCHERVIRTRDRLLSTGSFYGVDFLFQILMLLQAFSTT